MKYPTITNSACQRISDLKIRGLRAATEPETVWLGTGEDVDLAPIRSAARVATERVSKNRETSDRDQVEGELAGSLWDSLQHVPFSVLDDPGFWRYLSIEVFWDFIAWREAGSFETGNHLKYVNGVSSTESVLPRMYLRASAVGGSGHVDLASSLASSTDFWRSHVLRVRTGTAPTVTRELVESQKNDRLPTQLVRELAKGINRTWTNSIPQLLDADEARQLIVELRELLEQNPDD